MYRNISCTLFVIASCVAGGLSFAEDHKIFVGNEVYSVLDEVESSHGIIVLTTSSSEVVRDRSLNPNALRMRDLPGEVFFVYLEGGEDLWIDELARRNIVITKKLASGVGDDVFSVNTLTVDPGVLNRVIGYSACGFDLSWLEEQSSNSRWREVSLLIQNVPLKKICEVYGGIVAVAGVDLAK